MFRRASPLPTAALDIVSTCEVQYDSMTADPMSAREDGGLGDGKKRIDSQGEVEGCRERRF